MVDTPIKSCYDFFTGSSHSNCHFIDSFIDYHIDFSSIIDRFFINFISIIYIRRRGRERKLTLWSSSYNSTVIIVIIIISKIYRYKLSSLSSLYYEHRLYCHYHDQHYHHRHYRHNHRNYYYYCYHLEDYEPCSIISIFINIFHYRYYHHYHLHILIIVAISIMTIYFFIIIITAS